MSKYVRSLFIFRRDLRLEDNTGLNAALANSEQVIPCFILDPQQITKNPYRGDNSVEFMANSLHELSTALRELGSELYLAYDCSADAIPKIAQQLNAQAVFVNEDYTPFSRKRDQEIKDKLAALNITFESCEDLLLSSPRAIHKDDGKPYTVYTPFYKRAQKSDVRAVSKLTLGKLVAQPEFTSSLDLLTTHTPKSNPNLFRKGGRAEALRILNNFSKYANYDQERNLPALPGTTGLSAHLKFGTVSAREVYWKTKETYGTEHSLIRELYWRDFFTHIAFHFPHVFGRAFNTKLDALEWDYDQDAFLAWCDGQTGFPLVDAGMRELNATGFMHNRVRMVVASFLTKDLHIDWRWGEKYFAQKLIDYDPAVNNGNWQWASSTGCDAQPYFRIFNPWLQQEKFDRDAIYIKRWIPELETLSAKTIHNLSDTAIKRGSYPKPIVDHAQEKISTLAMFEAVKS